MAIFEPGAFIFGDKAFCLKGRMPTTISSTYSSELESFFRFGDSYLPAARWGVGDRPASKIFTIAAPRDIANVLNFVDPTLTRLLHLVGAALPHAPARRDTRSEEWRVQAGPQYSDRQSPINSSLLWEQSRNLEAELPVPGHSIATLTIVKRLYVRIEWLTCGHSPNTPPAGTVHRWLAGHTSRRRVASAS